MKARLLNSRLSLGLMIALCVIAAPVFAYVPLTVSFSDGEAVIAHWRQSDFPVSMVASDGLSPDISIAGLIYHHEMSSLTWHGIVYPYPLTRRDVVRKPYDKIRRGTGAPERQGAKLTRDQTHPDCEGIVAS